MSKKKESFECKLCGKSTYVLVPHDRVEPERPSHDYRRYRIRRCAHCYRMEQRAKLTNRQTIKRIVEEVFFDDFDSAGDVAMLVNQFGFYGDGLLVGGWRVNMWTQYHYKNLNLNTLNLLRAAFTSISEYHSCDIEIKAINYRDHQYHIILEIEIRKEAKKK